MRDKIFGAAALLAVLFSNALCEEWRLFTNFRALRDIAYAQGSLWGASGGGLVELTPDSVFNCRTTLDGLGGVGVRCLAVDADDGIWLAFDNRLVQRFQPGQGLTYTIYTLAQEAGISSINRIVAGAGDIFLATNRGIARLKYNAGSDRWIWLEEYRRFGSAVNPEARDLFLQDDSLLWAATNAGVVVGSLHNPNLVDGGSWRLWTTSDRLPANDVKALTLFNNKIYAATTGGVARLDADNVWRVFDYQTIISRLYTRNGRLLSVSAIGMRIWSSDGVPQIFDRRGLTSLTTDGAGRIYGGLTVSYQCRGGVGAFQDSAWRDFVPDGASSNLILAFAFAPNGEIVMAGGREPGEYGLTGWDGNQWRRWTLPEYQGLPFWFQPRALTFDLDGGLWVGSFMGGLARLNPDSSIDYYNHSQETGARLIGYGSSQPEIDRVLTPSVAVDLNGNVWTVNRGAANGRVLVCIPRDFIQDPQPDKEWIYFHRSLFGNYPHFDLIAIDAGNRKWIASTDPSSIAGRGVYVLDDRGTLNDPADDIVKGPIAGLNSPQLLSLAYDPDGYIWGGSIDGAYYVNAKALDLSNAQFSSVYWLRDIGINTIAIDPAGNKWFGSDFGITILASDLFTALRRITADPPDRLPDPKVLSIAIDPKTGWAYIGTNNGTAALRTAYRDFGQRIQALEIEPNPFNPNTGLLLFKGSSLAGGAEASIFTPDGRLVRRLSHFQAALGWDGNTDDGQPSADGIYLILTHNSSGQTSRGKIALIRR